MSDPLHSFIKRIFFCAMFIWLPRPGSFKKSHSCDFPTSFEDKFHAKDWSNIEIRKIVCMEGISILQEWLLWKARMFICIATVNYLLHMVVQNIFSIYIVKK